MPEILLRMKIGNDYTLPELKEVFNRVCNAVNGPENRKKHRVSGHYPSLVA